MGASDIRANATIEQDDRLPGLRPTPSGALCGQNLNSNNSLLEHFQEARNQVFRPKIRHARMLGRFPQAIAPVGGPKPRRQK
jgi:hypothetical protein